MHSILVVEDEPLELAALCANLKRIFGEPFQIYTADDGILAYELYEKEKPDLLLIDLNIPGMTGLELIRKIKKEECESKILILTAYDTSDFVRQAISLGVIDYLLKPVHRAELKEAVEKCIQLLEADQKQKQIRDSQTAISTYAKPHLVQDILQGSFPKMTMEKAYGWPENGKLAAAVFCFRDPGETYLENEIREILEYGNFFSYISSNIDHAFIVLAQLKGGLTREEQLTVLQAFGQMLWQKGMAETVMVSDLTETYEQLGEKGRFLCTESFSRKGFWMEYSAADPLFSEEEQQKIAVKWGYRLKEKQAARFVRMMRRKIGSSEDYWGYVSLFLRTFFQYDEEADGRVLLELFRSEKPFAALENWLADYFAKKEPISEKESADLIESANRWMEAHYDEDISRTKLAELLGLTETYFSHLYKQETGRSFVWKLTEIRMRHAREMLDAGITDMELISSECGYYNKKYFFDVFRRFMGIGVSEYQRKKEDEE